MHSLTLYFLISCLQKSLTFLFLDPIISIIWGVADAFEHIQHPPGGPAARVRTREAS
jgi:hypothetical protein